jgi:hypothetical protein
MNFLQLHFQQLSKAQLSALKNHLQLKHKMCRRTLNSYIKNPTEMRVAVAKTLASKMDISFEKFCELCK